MFSGIDLVFMEGGQQLLEGPLLFVHDIIINRVDVNSLLIRISSHNIH